MRIILITILAFLLFEPPPIGCSYFTHTVPENAYPENVGKFNRVYDLPGGMTEILTEYSNPNRPNQHSIDLKVSAGDHLDWSSAKCSAENIGREFSGVKLLKNQDLRDKSGKKAGVIRICQNNEQEAENFYIEMTNKDISFFIRTNNLYGEKDKTEMLKLEEIIEFAKEIPFNSNLDFESVQ